jgi:hypothetical protein
MTPQRQTIFSDDEKGTKGNCFTACIASIMDLPINEVPHFASYGQDWFKVFWEFLKDKPFEMNGTWSVQSMPNWKEEFNGIDGYVIVGGESPRGVKGGHAVIYKNGEPFFDPHPSDDFIVEEQDIYLIERK